MQPTAVRPAATPDLESEYRLPKSIPQLDRLRGLAILMVILFHAEDIAPPMLGAVLRQGWMGVDVFFVLSGFLITGILWESRDKKAYFRRFYWRRILRIWPVYLLLLTFAFGVIPLLKWSLGGLTLDLSSEPLGLWIFLLFLQNFFGDRLFLSTLLSMTWSLAIEEQFYFLWPAVLRFSPRRAPMLCLLAGVFLEPFIRIGAAHYGLSETAIYCNPLTHGDGLLCGAFVALWLRSAKPRRKTLLIAGLALLLVGAMLYAFTHTPPAVGQQRSPLLFSCIALFSTGLLLLALVSENLGALVHRFFFMNRTLAFFGFVSYSLYLFHYPIVRLGLSHRLAARLDYWHHPALTRSMLVVCALGLSVLLAWISRVTLERAALSKKDLFG